MAVKRSLISWKRNHSLAYFEILLETQVVLIVVTELSLEWAAYSLPALREIRVNPVARGRVLKWLLGIGQNEELWEQVFTASVSGDQRIDSAASQMGTVTLFCATGFLYASFARFILANKNWRPPTFSVPSQLTANKWHGMNVLPFMTILIQGIMAVYLLMCQTGWRAVAISGPDNVILMWYVVSYALFYAYAHANYEPSPVDAVDKAKTSGAEQPEHVSKEVLRRELSLARWLGEFFLLLLCPVVALCLAPFAPMIPVMVWAGLVQSTFLLCGERTASAVLIIVTCLLIVYSMGRMLHLWLGGSWAERVLPGAIKWFAAYTKQDFIFRREAVPAAKLPHLTYFARNPRTVMTDILLDCTTICVIACAVVSAFPDGKMYPDSLYALVAIGIWSRSSYEPLPQCISPMVVKFSYWTNTNHVASANATDTICQEHTLSSTDSVVGDAIHLTCGSLLAAAAVPAFLVITAAVCHVLYIIRQKCIGSVPETKIVADETEAWKQDVYDWHNALSLFPVYFVKIILPFYALDFFLPEKLHIPGLTACLLAYGICLYRKLAYQIAAYMKYRQYNPGWKYNGELDEPALLIA